MIRIMHAGGEILLGVVNGESTMDRAILVQSCDHIPNRAAWMAGGYVMGGQSCSYVHQLQGCVRVLSYPASFALSNHHHSSISV